MPLIGFYAGSRKVLGHSSKKTLISHDGNAKDDVDKKMNFSFKLEFRKWTHVFTVPYGASRQLQHTQISSVEFQMEIKIISHRGFRTETTQHLVHLVFSRCCFSEDG